ncbi:MAG: DUF3126 family protein [Alphaproteobacteria bacterium]
MEKGECLRVERYFQKLFKLDTIEVRRRPHKDDSAEVYVGEEFVGVLFRDDDEEDDESSYSFQMAILEIDLEGF